MDRIRPVVLVALLGLVLLLVPLLPLASAPPSGAYAADLPTATKSTALARAASELAANPADQHLAEQKGAPLIRLKSRAFTPAPGVGPALKGQLERLQAKAVDRAHVFLQFNKISDKAERQALTARGVELLTYIPDRAWLASVPVTLNLDDLIASSPARWAGAILPGDKLETDLREGRIHKWAQDVDERVILVVQFFPDVDLEVGADLVTAYRGKVLHRVESINSLVVSLPEDAVSELATEDIVEWIEQVKPALSPVNDGVRANIGADALQAAPYNLDGTGVRVLVFDGGGVDTTHPDFGGRVSLQSDAPGISDHSTHVAGTIGGDGTQSVAAGGTARQWRGMAPNVDIVSDDYDAGAGPYIFYNNPGSIQAEYNEAVGNGADMANNSIGMNLCTNYVDPDQVLPLDNPGLMPLYGDYETTAQLLDNVVTGNWTGSTRFPLFYSSGNERNDTCFQGTPGFSSISTPATAKNPIIVGAINSNDNTITTFSSYGPLDDGRLKPDVVAPGCQTSVDFGVTSTFTDTFYTTKCGTSMAAPAVTGISALLLQQWRQTCASSDPLPSTYKALLVNTAQDLGNPGPDYAFGWGRVQAQLAADAIINQEVVEGSITHGGVYTYYVAMQSGGPQLRVTLAWDDPAAAPLSAVQLVNDLDLVVIGPNATIHRPWLLDPTNPGNNATTGIDNLNNVEQVVVAIPEDGIYTVTVSGANVPSGPQPFSLAIQPIDLFVNSTADTGDGNPGDGICDTGTFASPTGICTLRAAIEEANATVCVSDTIKFNIPVATDPGCNAGTGVCTIQPLSALPVITDTVAIDGYTQPGASVASSDAVLKIVLDGSLAGNGVNGLVLETDDSTIRGLAIHGFRVTNLASYDFSQGNGIVVREGISNTITGNFIGTNVDGDACVGNGGSGVLIGGPNSTGDANSNTVGGTNPADRNIITCNGFQDQTVTGWDGVTIWTADFAADDNEVLGNYIGTDVTGAMTLTVGTDTFGRQHMGNTGNGVRIAGGDSNTVGGTSAGARNILSGNELAGVRIEGVSSGGANDNEVLGNYIGTDVSGTSDLGNLDVGVYIVGIENDADDNDIGGMDAGASNLIAGNGAVGVSILGGKADGNVVQGNYIGTDVNGAVAMPNDSGGIMITDAMTNTIGGTTATARNLVSGNGGVGVSIINSAEAGDAYHNVIQGNYIGTEVSGTAALSNTLTGVVITDAADNDVGDTAAGAGNLISGNGEYGVIIMESGATGNDVQGNYIGTDFDGDAAIANQGAGVLITNASSNTVGGAAGNLISGNVLQGVRLIGADDNTVRDNLIGTQADGTSPLGNSSHGVVIADGDDNDIGIDGVFPQDNTIAYNGGDGVLVLSGIGNRILSNSIFDNDELGIDLGDDNDVTPNDDTDPDTGANNLQNFPVLTTASVNGNTTIEGVLNSTASTQFTIQFFANAACDPSGFGEGRTYLATDTPTTDGAGDTATSATVAGDLTGQFITATATDPYSNTSEFSNCIPVPSAPVLTINKEVQDLNGGSAKPGDTLLYTINYSNTGNAPATGVIITDTYSISCTTISNVTTDLNFTTFFSDTTRIRWPATDGILLDAQASGSVSYRCTLQASFPAGITGVENTATIDSDQTTPQEDTETVQVTVAPVLTIDKECTPATGNRPADTVHCVIQYANTGDAYATGATIVDDYDQSKGSVSGITGSAHFAAGTNNGDTIAWGPSTIPAGESGQVEYDYTLAGAGTFPHGTTPVTNTATIDSNDTGSVADPETVQVTAAAVLTIDKEGQDPNGGLAEPGDILQYTINYANTGNAQATGVFITDDYSDLCASISNVTTDLNFPTFSDTGGVLRWLQDPDTTTLAAGASGSLTYDCTLQDPFPAGTTRVTNTSTIDLDETGPEQDTEILFTVCFDFNENGVVDVGDIMEVVIRWGLTAANPDPDGDPATPNYEAKYDANGDGVITVVDIMMVAGQWGQTC